MLQLFANIRGWGKRRSKELFKCCIVQNVEWKPSCWNHCQGEASCLTLDSYTKPETCPVNRNMTLTGGTTNESQAYSYSNMGKKREESAYSPYHKQKGIFWFLVKNIKWIWSAQLKPFVFTSIGTSVAVFVWKILLKRVRQEIQNFAAQLC